MSEKKLLEHKVKEKAPELINIIFSLLDIVVEITPTEVDDEILQIVKGAIRLLANKIK